MADDEKSISISFILNMLGYALFTKDAASKTQFPYLAWDRY